MESFFYDCKNKRDGKNNNKRRKTFKRRKNNFKKNIIKVEIMQFHGKKKSMIQAMSMFLPRITIVKNFKILILPQ